MSVDPSSAPFAPGSVLAGRFEVHGVVGRGGTATVVLATDRLRQERVALKIVHPHLAADPAARRRLLREVRTATVLRSDAALVPYDLHELDGGGIALSMPFHPGQTLADRIASGGPLPIADVRALGRRIAAALADAHRAGVLHRDVTANNVMIADDPGAAVLTDFGLARLLGGTRTTGLLGTAGYAAPEVYTGDGSDPRSDLYGLGAVLYLAVTGRPPFDPREPAVAFKRQLDETFPAVRDLRPDCPADLASTIEQLLRADPESRPQAASDVGDALARSEPLVAPIRVQPTSGTFMPVGTHTVIVKERDEDRRRRRRLRRERIGDPVPIDPGDELARWGRHLAGRVRDALGVPAPSGLSPEQGLVRIVAREAGIPESAIEPSPVLLDPRFRLIDGVDRTTAERVAEDARALGFRAEVVQRPSWTLPRWVWPLYALIVALGWTAAASIESGVASLLILGFTVGVPIALSQQSERSRLDRYAIAYRADLRGMLRPGVAVAAPHAATTPKPSTTATRGQQLAARAEQALSGLDEAIGASELPELARTDLRSTSRELRDQATGLAVEIDSLDAALKAANASDVDTAALQARLDRLDTLARAGERVDRTERERLSRALTADEDNRAAADRLESQLASATARLIEIASTATRVRRELLVEPDVARTADELVGRLRTEAKAAADAKREAGKRATRARDLA